MQPKGVVEVIVAGKAPFKLDSLLPRWLHFPKKLTQLKTQITMQKLNNNSRRCFANSGYRNFVGFNKSNL